MSNLGDFEKYRKLVTTKLDVLTDAQLKKLHSDLDKKVSSDSYAVFVKYNAKDNNIITKMDNKIGFIRQALTVAHMSRSPVSDILGTVKPWDNMVYHYLNQDKVIIPPQKSNEEVEYLGGYVKEPIIGRHNWVVSVDLTSLYPSIIRMLNMSYETLKYFDADRNTLQIIQDMIEMKYDTSAAKKHGYAIASNGSMYSKDKEGIIPKIMTFLFNERKRVKGLMNQTKKEREAYKKNNHHVENTDEYKFAIKKFNDKIAMYDAQQQALKILANSGYGAIGNPNFRYYHEAIAEGITSTGQVAIQYIAKQLNIFLNDVCGTKDYDYVVAVDTDSVVGDTIIKTNVGDIRIDDFFNNADVAYIENRGEDNIIKHVKGKGYTAKTFKDGKVVEREVNYIMAHKVKKRMYKLKCKGKEVIVTCDHSLVVLRDNVQIDIKPSEMKKGDCVVLFCDVDITDDWEIEDLGIQEQWVYDIEVEDTHTFFANDILVHNSNYITLSKWVLINMKDGMTKDDIVTMIDDYVTSTIEPYIDDCYKKLSDYLNACENLLIMKREAIADCAIFRKKKNYIINVYDNEHVRYDQPYLKMMGIETARTSTPMIVRKELEKCLKLLVAEKFDEMDKEVDSFKDVYYNSDIETIAIPRGVSDIDKWIGSRGELLSGTPIHVRAAYNYNKMLDNNPELAKRYERIKNGSKIKFIKLTPNNPVNSHVIAFVDELPPEFNIEKYVDKKGMYEDTFLSPLESFSNLVNHNLRFKVADVSSLFGDFSVGNTSIEEPHKPLSNIGLVRPKKEKPKFNESNISSLFD